MTATIGPHTTTGLRSGRRLLQILVVDDDREDLLILRRLLNNSELEFQLHIFSESLQRLEDCCRGGGYDCLILDHFLHGVTGLELIQRHPDIGRSLPVILATTGQSDAMQAAVDAEQIEAFLSKSQWTPLAVETCIRFACKQWHLKQELRRSRADALNRERLGMLAHLTRGISHEFNNLNAIVQGSLEQIALRKNLDKREERLLCNAFDAIHRGSDLIRNLNRLAKPLQEPDEIIDLTEALQEASYLIKHDLLMAGITLDCRLPERSEFAFIGRADLLRVLLAVLRNAVHAVTERPQPRIVLSLYHDQDQVTIVIRDNGVGIATNDRPKVFLPFFSRKAPQAADSPFPAPITGSGLGLTICEAILHQARGAIDIDSAEGRGTEVRIHLPRHWEISGEVEDN